MVIWIKGKNKKFLKLLLMFIIVTALIGLGVKIYMYFFYVHVEVSNIPKLKAPVASNAITGKNTESAPVVWDDWNYVDNKLSIRIQKIEKNSGKEKATMFVADIKLSDINYLHTAFAKNEFGLHITQKVSQMALDNNALLAISNLFVSVVGARVISSIINFRINRSLVFKPLKKHTFTKAIYYYSLASILLISDYMFLWFFSYDLKINLFWIKVLTELILFSISFTVRHFVIFRKTVHL